MRNSGRFLLRIPPDLHASLNREAHARGVSLNALCVDRLRTVPAHTWNQEIQAEFPEVRAAILFGSSARGEAGPDSDVDLMLVLREASSPARALYARWDRKRLPCSPHFASLPEEPGEAGGIWCEIAIDGIVLWEEGSAVSTMLRRIRSAIADGALQRRFSHGHPYWVRS